MSNPNYIFIFIKTQEVQFSAWHTHSEMVVCRYSLAFFFDPDFYTNVECVPSCRSTDNPAKFPPIESGAYILQLYADTHKSYKAKEDH